MQGLWDPSGTLPRALLFTLVPLRRNSLSSLIRPTLSSITSHLLWSPLQNTLCASKSALIYVQCFPWILTVDLFQNRVWNIHLCQHDWCDGKGYSALKLSYQGQEIIKIIWSSSVKHWFGHSNKRKNPMLHKCLRMPDIDFPLFCRDQIVILSKKWIFYFWKLLAPVTEQLVMCWGFKKAAWKACSFCGWCNLQFETALSLLSSSGIQPFCPKLLWAGLVLVWDKEKCCPSGAKIRKILHQPRKPKRDKPPHSTDSVSYSRTTNTM